MSTRPVHRHRLAALWGCLHRPHQPRLVDARDVARDADTAAAAWEALSARGVIPLDWAPHATRRFVAYDPATTETSADALTHPPTRGACVAFASDPVGVTTAEALARELVARLAPWGAAQPERVIWIVGEARAPLSLEASGLGAVLDTIDTLIEHWASSPRTARYARRDRSAPRRAARTALKHARRASWDQLRQARRDAREGGLAAALSAMSALWDFAAREFLHVSRMAAMRHRVSPSLVGVRVGAMRSPFDVVLALYELGYGLGPLTGEALCLTAVEPAMR